MKDRKAFRVDPAPDSWPWERARRSVAMTLRRIFWRINNGKTGDGRKTHDR